MRSLFAIILSAFIFFTCSEESNPEFEVKNFTSIFDTNNFDASYYPIDMLQTPDGGYLILGGRKLEDSDFSGIYLLKADKFGNFVKELEVEESSVNPVASFMFNAANNKYYFFCMDAFTQRAQVAEVDVNIEAVTMNPVNQGITYPAAASPIDNSFLLLSYNNGDKLSVLSFVNTEGNVITTKGYSIGTGDDIEEPIINHFIHTGKQFPFEVGKVSDGLYYFNGFFNYTFSLVFTDFGDNPVGVVQGQQDDGGFSAVTNISGNKFATSRFNFGDNFIIPNTTLQPNNTTSSINLGGYSIPELVPNAKVKILRATINEKNVLIYGCDTKTKQIGLLFYDEATGEFISSKYLGFSNPFEIASILRTEDEGLAVCGTTYLAGRFPRICIFKISKEDLSKQVN